MPLIVSFGRRKMSSPCPPSQSQFKHCALGHGIGGRSPMRRVSLPSALPPPRTPNTLSPKFGFLKEISEFDMDPPFISPAGSSSSSADNSPMLLSPAFQRPSSARLYRRNPQQQRHSQPNSPGTRKARISNGRTMPKEEEDDGFRWTDVDGFYGRKNSIPLQQLLANDLALLNGTNLLDGGDYGDKKHSVVNNGINNVDSNNLLNVVQQQEVNIPSDITEDDDEEEEEDGGVKQKEKDEVGMGQQRALNNGNKVNMRRSLGIPHQTYQHQKQHLLDSPTKRKLFMESKFHSFEDGTKEHLDLEEEQNEGEQCADDGQIVQNLGRSFSAKVKFGNEFDGIPFVDGTIASQRVLKLGKDMRKRRHRIRRAAKMAHAQQLRHFSVDAHGQRIVDSGMRTVRASTDSKGTAQQSRSSKNRRATCPEIWLSAAEDTQLLPRVDCALRLYGLINCGKKTVAKQLASCLEAESANEDDLASIDSEDLQRPYRTVAFLLNEREVHMELIQGSLLPENRHFTPGGELTIFAVVYSVDNRESFIRAAQILFRLFGVREGMASNSPKGGRGRNKSGADIKDKVPLILIANKIDLQRKRRVSPIEGKMLAKIYKCPFVELSAMLSANTDTLCSEVLRRLHKYLQTREQLLLQHHRDSSGDTATSSPRHAFVGRILERTRRFAKSCEDWIAARIVPL